MNDTDYEKLQAAIKELAPLIRQHADTAEQQRYLPHVVANAMAQAGLYRVAAPKSLAGSELHPIEQIKIIEAISEIDGATGWNLMIGIEIMGILGAIYPQDFAEKIYKDPGLIISGALNPLGKAVRVDNGYRISGQWPFASGIHNADYFWGQSIIYENGQAQRDNRGPLFCEALFTQDEFEIVDTWHVSGLRGSGSHDVKVTEVYVPDQRISQSARTHARKTSTLYRLPLYTRLAYNKVGVASGIARAAIDNFKRLATSKIPRVATNKLQYRVDAQLAIAEAEYLLGSARAYVFQTVESVWDTVEKGDKPTAKQKALVYLACSKSAAVAVSAVEKLYAAAGATANFTSSPLERAMRDVLVVRQHIMISSQFQEKIGRVLLGLDSETFMF